MIDIRPCFGDAYFDEDIMWYFDNSIFSLCRMNLKTGKVDILAVYTGERTFGARRIFANKGVLFITAYNSSDILKYSKSENKIDVLKNVQETFLPEYLHNFYDYHMCIEDKIWFFSTYYEKPVYYFDMQTEQFYQDDILNKYISKHIEKGKIAALYANGYKDCYWTALYNTNIFIKHSLKDRSIEEFKIVDANIHLNAICYDGEKIWLTQSDNGNIICIEKSGKIINIFEGISNGVGKEFSKIINTRDRIVVLPRLGDTLLLIDKKDMKMRKVNLTEMDLDYVSSKHGWAKILNCLELEDKLFFLPWGLDSLFTIGRSGSELKKIEISYLESELMSIMLNREKSISESQDISLECLVKYSMLLDRKVVHDENLVGKKIFDGMHKLCE